jgi:hypothetical protein
MFPVDAFRLTLGKAIAIFERHSIRFHLTGGITSVVYGEPRMTQDIDIVIDNRAIANELESFLASLKASDFMHDADEVRRAVANQAMFQLLDLEESLKLDIYPRELIPGELERSCSSKSSKAKRCLLHLALTRRCRNWFGSAKEVTRAVVTFATSTALGLTRIDIGLKIQPASCNFERCSKKCSPNRMKLSECWRHLK